MVLIVYSDVCIRWVMCILCSFLPFSSFYPGTLGPPCDIYMNWGKHLDLSFPVRRILKQ